MSVEVALHISDVLLIGFLLHPYYKRVFAQCEDPFSVVSEHHVLMMALSDQLDRGEVSLDVRRSSF